jgi:thymidylate synthase
MKSYLNIVEKVLAEGVEKHNRTGVNALTIPGYLFEHDMAEGFPLLTTKKMATRAIMVELEGFLRGITSKKWYQERGCRIWDEWANPKAVERRMIQWQNDHVKEYEDRKSLVEASVKLQKQFQKEENDLGPIYGYQWRKFGQHYGPLHYTPNEKYPGQGVWHPNGANHGEDQLKTILTKLKNNPTDRRMVCSAWNPNQIPMMALPPCHYAWTVIMIEDTLNLIWKQRSCDLMLGVPFNIASYAALQLLLCKFSGFKPGKLQGLLEDCHIYVNHIEGAKEQLTRTPLDLPEAYITVDPFDIDAEDIVKWTYKDIKFLKYNSHPKIPFEVAV